MYCCHDIGIWNAYHRPKGNYREDYVWKVSDLVGGLVRCIAVTHEAHRLEHIRDKVIDSNLHENLIGGKQTKLVNSDSDFKILFERLAKSCQWQEIDRILGEVYEKGGTRPSCKTLSNVIHLAGKAGAVYWASKYFTRMQQIGIQPSYVTFGILMTMYQKFHLIKEAEQAFELMLSTGCHCMNAYSAMIVLYCRSSMYAKAEKTIEVLESFHLIPDRANLLAQINVFAQQGKTLEAEKVVKTMQEAGLWPHLIALNSLIKAYGEAGLYEKALSSFQEISNVGLMPDEVSFNSMIGASMKAGKFKDAYMLYKQMQSFGFSPSNPNVTSIIKMCEESQNEKILEILMHMKKAGCRPDVGILDAILRIYKKDEKLDLLRSILDFMKEAGWLRSGMRSDVLCLLYIEWKMPQKAVEYFQLMRNSGIIPKAFLCHRVILACKEAGMYADAHKIFLEMKDLGIVPSLDCTCTIMDLYGLMGHVSKAEELFSMLRKSKQKLDAACYNVMINAYAQAGSVNDVSRILRLMEEAHIPPDAYTFHPLLKLYKKCSMHEEAIKSYRRMREIGITLDGAMYNSVINYCGRHLPVEEVAGIFEDMMAEELLPNSITCNLMLDIYGKGGDLEKAQSLLKFAEENGIADRISYNTLIDAYGKYGDLRKMETTFYGMQNAGFTVSLEAFNSMLDAYGKAGNISRLEEVSERMQMSACDFDITTYNILINVYGKKGLLEEMEKMLTRMHKVSLVPDRWTYNTLIGAYGCLGMPDESVRIFKEMHQAGTCADRVTYVNLIASFERSGNLLEAARWSVWMSQAGYSKSDSYPFC